MCQLFTMGGCLPATCNRKTRVADIYIFRKAFPGVIPENKSLEVKSSRGFGSLESFLRDFRRMTYAIFWLKWASSCRMWDCRLPLWASGNQIRCPRSPFVSQWICGEAGHIRRTFYYFFPPTPTDWINVTIFFRGITSPIGRLVKTAFRWFWIP